MVGLRYLNNTGWWLSPTPPTNMKVSWDNEMSQYMESHKIHVPMEVK